MKKILTIILDGYGIREEENGNAIKMAETPNFDRIWETYPHTTLFASEEYVGLKKGQFGNSEIGHKTIGAGRLLKQKPERVDDFTKSLDENEKFQEFIEYLNSNNKSVHFIGMLSDKDVHSNHNNLLRIIEALKGKIKNDVYYHVITDGRDTEPDVALKYIHELQNTIKKTNIGSIATICGRFYAMDRDKNWERTKVYMDLITKGIGISVLDIDKGINKCYEANIDDEHIKPLIINKDGIIKNGDTIVWLNHRGDRSVQLLNALTNENFEEISIRKLPDSKIFSFFPFDKPIKTYNFLDGEMVKNPLGIYLSELGLTQARVAETEKYAHVTYFFDGEYEGKIDKCDKYLIPSPKVNSYDKIPEMSAIEVTKKTIACMEKDYDFILTNFANPDMVGHTGNLEATVGAITVVDICLGKLLEAAEENFYKVIVLADHGNADTMLDENGEIVKTHTTAKVPFVVCDKNIKVIDGGDLTNVAPSILDYMDIAVPKEMQDVMSIIEDGD
ncbi:MAG: 2,3-bisphosphoglycerate-independent phosphoglycerate mutase [Clostridia bacterium]|nr:2,3-bisphosphoglycerate-independent phosphoglycerate mutase [Clostridia bacterium]